MSVERLLENQCYKVIAQAIAQRGYRHPREESLAADKHERQLAAKESRNEDRFKNLAEERADQLCQLFFPLPEDEYYRALARRDILAAQGIGEALTIEESADLLSKRQFPNKADDLYRMLARAEILNIRGMGKALPSEDQANLASKREFPDEKNDYFRDLARREYLHQAGQGQDLDQRERSVLRVERSGRTRFMAEFDFKQ